MNLQIFAKAPIYGQVKTRLIPKIGAASATNLHKQFVRLNLQKFSRLFNVQLWCAPDESHPFFQTCQQQFAISLHRQQGIGLGERMANALNSDQPTVLIGSDCPILSPKIISDAFAALETDYSVVLSPAEDGGYVLIGMRQLIPEIFTNIPWGTSEVFSITKQRLNALGIKWHQLPTLWDVDRPEDLERWYQLKLSNEYLV
ncbi:TIGR04282 family arsenosugar biosynthesis glycosyltransferase [Candidatus Marithrix sp. Canyon 246]|uniref:TIGR04282 family arsenosugar biosynthesis glycosyltransferase n=1 Tax=Candidatus Marithrix sp. Canyon 246 TaxID=1827136 RepID=UPI0014958272|nr:TIGR04282 family arsenosugar biosynthesis glycosyltransferase [Candidatus Marithrix sp. Canyon 246]